MNHSTGKPTKYEQNRIDAMLKLGCVVSAQLGFWTVAEVHHIVDGNRRLGHWYTLPVSPGFHRGVWSPEQIELIPPDLRIAISDGSKLFEKHYGTQRELWMKIQARLKLPAIWPSSKILPRRGRHVEVDTSDVAVRLNGAARSGNGSPGDSDVAQSSEAATGGAL